MHPKIDRAPKQLYPIPFPGGPMHTINLKDVKVKELPGRKVYVLSENLEVSNLTVGICEVPPNSTMVPHRHTQEETIYILRGHGHVVINGEKEPVSPGTLVHFPSNSQHCTSNETDEVMQFMFSFAPQVVLGSYG
jgi:quercetin dioxygenase-like cupin family protein